MDAEPMSEMAAVRLERGELLALNTCPFPLPPSEDLAFLRSADIGEKTYHDVEFDPLTHRFAGVGTLAGNSLRRVESILSDFSESATDWLMRTFPCYASDVTIDRAWVRVHEEATRSIRHSGRNDVLHIDSFPTRPTGGKRVLRICVNFHEVEDRVWAIGETFPALLKRYPGRHRIPVRSRKEWTEPAQSWQRLLQRDWSGRPAYDSFMYRLEEFLKTNETIQEQILKRYCHFRPGSAWALFADGLSHAVLRGQFALEHTFWIADAALLDPESAPLSHMMQLGRQLPIRRAG